MFTLCDLRFVLFSLDLDVLRAQRITGFFKILITHKSKRSKNPITWLESDVMTGGLVSHVVPPQVETSEPYCVP